MSEPSQLIKVGPFRAHFEGAVLERLAHKTAGTWHSPHRCVPFEVAPVILYLGLLNQLSRTAGVPAQAKLSTV